MTEIIRLVNISRNVPQPALQKLAEDETRSLSNYVVTVLIKHLQEHGIDWRKEKPQ